MTVLIICNGYPSTLEPNIYIFIHRQALALKKAGYNVVILDIDLRSFRWKRKYGCYFEKYEGIEVYRISFPFVTTMFPRIYKFLNVQIGLKLFDKIIKKVGKIDLINAHFVKGAGQAAIAIKKKHNKLVVITEHSSKIMMDCNKLVEQFIPYYMAADKVIVVSEALKVKLERYGITCKTIANVIDTSIFKVIEHGDKNSSFTYLSVGNLIYRKRFDLTIRAFCKLHEKYKNTNLIIVGEGPLDSQLKLLAEKLKINSVTFIGGIDNNMMSELYNKCDCFVLPSDYETFGVVYAEAISCGIPAIAADNGGSKEIIDERNGLIVPRDDINALYKALEVMYESKSKYNKYKLHKIIENKFGEMRFVNQIEELYIELVCRVK